MMPRIAIALLIGSLVTGFSLQRHGRQRDVPNVMIAPKTIQSDTDRIDSTDGRFSPRANQDEKESRTTIHLDRHYQTSVSQFNGTALNGASISTNAGKPIASRQHSAKVSQKGTTISRRESNGSNPGSPIYNSAAGVFESFTERASGSANHDANGPRSWLANERLPVTPTALFEYEDESLEAPSREGMDQIAREFVSTMKNSGLDTNSLDYLRLWNLQQLIADTRYKARYGGTSWMKLHVAARFHPSSISQSE